LKISAKKGYFINFKGKKQILPLLAPPGKFLEKSPSGPRLEKILPTPIAPMRSLHVSVTMKRNL